MNKTIGISLIALVICAVTTAPANAGPTYGFTRITNNGNTNVAGQLFVEVDSFGEDQVLFTFTNAGPAASVITGIYFDDGTLLSIANVLNDIKTPVDGVDFAAIPNSPPPPWNVVLPGGSTVGFEVTAGFAAAADNPKPTWGVDPYEAVGIVFSLQDNKTLADVLTDLDTGALRIGLHVQSIGETGGSDSYVNGPAIPAPGALLLGSIGVGVVGWLRRRRTL